MRKGEKGWGCRETKRKEEKTRDASREEQGEAGRRSRAEKKKQKGDGIGRGACENTGGRSRGEGAAETGGG
jgi:hypothetical protein